MKVIPVIDILNGVAVHAFRGKRSQYKPLESILCKSADPLMVASSFKALGFGELYIADLDAIIDCSRDFGVIKHIAEKTGLNLIVDAGVTSTERAERLLASGSTKIVVGTETLKTKNFVAQAVERFGNKRVIVSLDLKAGKLLAKEGFDGCNDPLCLLQEFKETGVGQVIVLDLTRVGSGEGVDFGFLKKVIAEVGIDTYVGGGVRDLNDLNELKSLGIAGALVASSLHTGKLSIEDLKREGFL